MTLSPPLVSVSGERVRSELVRILGIPASHQGRILLFIRSDYPANQSLSIQSTPFSDGWQFSITLPEQIEWQRFVRAIVEAILLDVANSDPGAALSPIPLWISEGATFLLVSSSGKELVPEPNRGFRDPSRSMDPLAAVLRHLEGQSPLDFSTLSLPSEALISDPARFPVFQASSALLVHDLPRFSGLPNPVVQLLQELQGHLNWQSAMLRAWSSRFHSLLEIEKWWAVQSSSRILRDPNTLWSRQATLAQMLSILSESTSLSTNLTSGAATLRLSRVVVEWPFRQQQDLLNRKVLQLQNLYPLADPDLLPLIQRLHSVLRTYLDARSQASQNTVRRGEPSPAVPVVTTTASSALSQIEEQIRSMQ